MWQKTKKTRYNQFSVCEWQVFVIQIVGSEGCKKKVCQNAHLHYFTYKAPTFTSWGFVIT